MEELRKYGWVEAIMEIFGKSSGEYFVKESIQEALMKSFWKQLLKQSQNAMGLLLCLFKIDAGFLKNTRMPLSNKLLENIIYKVLGSKYLV